MSSKASHLAKKRSSLVQEVLDVSGLVRENSRRAHNVVSPLSRNFSHPAAASARARTPRMAPSSRRLSMGNFSPIKRTTKSEEIVLCHPIKPSTSPVSGKRQHPVLSSLDTSPIRQPRRTRRSSLHKKSTSDRKQTLEIWTKKNEDSKKKSETTKSSKSPTKRESLKFSPKTREAREHLMRKLLEIKVKTKDSCVRACVV